MNEWMEKKHDHNVQRLIMNMIVDDDNKRNSMWIKHIEWINNKIYVTAEQQYKKNDTFQFIL